MSPDDPRHGKYAGYQQHAKDHETACDPCKRAQHIYFKQMKYRLHLHGPERVELGEHAWTVIDSTGRRELSRATGLRDSFLSRLRGAGPTTKVYRRTRDAILAARTTATPVGIQRRLQAMHAIGYSGAFMAGEAGMSVGAVRQLLVAAHPRPYHHESVTTAIVALYERLSDRPAPRTRQSSAARNKAARLGFHPPAAWDNIDNPHEQPATPEPRTVGRPRRIDTVLEDFAWLTSQGISAEHAAARVGVTLATIEDYRRRAGRAA